MREIYRVLDANLNRLREGLRVLEEVSRFVLNNNEMTAGLKDLRHQVATAAAGLPGGLMELIEARKPTADVGAGSWTTGEASRNSLMALATANCKRIQEAARVLEEFGKMCEGPSARSFKEIRFTAYKLEIELLKKLNESACNSEHSEESYPFAEHNQ
jgi:thiamine-phosphate pyrophosphorylase